MHDHDRKDASANDYVISLTLRLIQLARNEGYNILTLQDVSVEWIKAHYSFNVELIVSVDIF